MGMVHKGGNAVPFHGDHHPVKVATHRNSRNLLQTGITPSKTTNGVTYSRNDDGSITVNGTATNTAYFNLDFDGGISSAVNYWTGYIGKKITVSGGNYGVGLTCGLFTEDGQFKNICSSESGNAATATVPDDAYKMRSYLSVNKGTTVDNVTIYPQVELGSIATEYEPYGLIEEPIFEPIDQAHDGKTLTFENTYNDTAEVTVFGESTQKTLAGKNLIPFPYAFFDGINKGIEWTFNSDGSISAHGTSNSVSYACLSGGYANQMEPVPSWLEAGKTYTFSFDRTLPRGVDAYIYKYTSSSVGSPYVAVYQGSQSKTFTMPSDLTDWLYFGIFLSVSKGATVDFDALFPQIEKGSTATDYEPYCGGIPAPNPDYPQPIESIKSVELVSRWKNLLAYTDTFDIEHYYNSNGEQVDGEVFNNMFGKLSAVKTVMAWRGPSFAPTSVFERCNVKPGDLLTYSVWFKCDFAPIKSMPFTLFRSDANNKNENCVGNGSTAKIYTNNSNTIYVDYSDIQPGKWYRLWYTFVAPDDWSGIERTRIESGYYTTSDYKFGTNGESIYFAGLMLEKDSNPHEFEPYRYSSRTIDLQGHELRSLPDGTHDDVVVHRDGTVELVMRCDASMFDPSYPVSNEWKLAAPRTIQLPSIDPLQTYYPYTFVDGNGANISARVRVFPGPTYKMFEDGGN